MGGNAKLLIAIWVMQFVNYADRVVVSFAGPSMMKSLSIDTDSFGIVLSSFSLGYLLSQIPGGIIADKWGARAVVIVGPLFWALFTGLTGLVSTIAALIAARMLFGVSEGLSNAATYKLIGDNFAAEDRPRAMSIWVTALAIAPALTGPAVGMLLSSFGWHEVFLLLAVPALAVAAVNFALVPSVGPQAQNEENRATNAGFRSVLSEPSLWLICGAYGFWSIAYWGFLGWMPSYLALERHIDIKGAGILGGLPYVFGLCGGLAAGWAGAKIGSRGRPYFLAAVYLLACLALFGAFASATLALSVASLSIAGLFMYAGLATYGAVVLDLAPGRARAAYAGVVSTAGQIGGTLAPTAIGYLVKATGSFGAGFAFMSASLCIAAVCALALVPIKARQQGRIAAQVAN